MLVVVMAAPSHEIDARHNAEIPQAAAAIEPPAPRPLVLADRIEPLDDEDAFIPVVMRVMHGSAP
jgi:hypothetical protein